MKRKKSDRTKLINKLVSWAKKTAKERDGYICQKCRKTVSGANAHGSHVIPTSRSLRLSYDVVNIKCLCYRCHFYFWHKNPLEADEWFRKTFPKRWKYLKEEMLKPVAPVKTFELEETKKLNK